MKISFSLSSLRPKNPGAFFFALVGGLSFWLGFPNFLTHAPFAAMLTPFFICLAADRAGSFKEAAFYGWLAIFCGASLALYWISIPMHDFASAPWVAGAAATMLLGGYVGLYGAAFAMLARLFQKAFPLPLTALCIALAWGALELARGVLLTGFPWLPLSASMVPWPTWIQGAALVGVYGLSAVYALVGAFMSEAVRRRGGKKPVARILALLAGHFVLLAMLIYGRGVLGAQEAPTVERTARIGVVQGNVRQDVKWEPSWQLTTVRDYLRLSRLAVEEAKTTGGPLDLVVWPETAIPLYFQRGGSLVDYIRAFTRESDASLFFGVPAYEPSKERNLSYNRIWLLDRAGNNAGRYDKEHLVPFGEYIPLNLSLPFAENFLQGHYFTPGGPNPPLAVERGAHAADDPKNLPPILIGGLVCYEGIFPELAQAMAASGANLLVNVSNDGWFGKSAAARQHLELTAMRAVEQRRYLILATNTGISALVDEKGRILTTTPLFEALQFTGTAITFNEKTPFNKYYSLIHGALILCPVLLTLLAVPVVVVRNRRKKYS